MHRGYGCAHAHVGAPRVCTLVLSLHPLSFHEMIFIHAIILKLDIYKLKYKDNKLDTIAWLKTYHISTLIIEIILNTLWSHPSDG